MTDITYRAIIIESPQMGGCVLSQVILVGGSDELIELCLEAGLEIVASFNESTPEDQIQKTLQARPQVPLLLGEENGERRRLLVETYQKIGRRFTGVIHPDAKVAGDTEIGVGAIIQIGCFVSTGCKVGAFSRLDVGTVLMSDVSVGSYCTFEPRALVLAGAKIKAQAHLGASCVIKQKAEIPAQTRIEVGQVVG